MPTWGEILQEVQQSAVANGGQPDFDGIRRRYLAALHAYTGRDTIIYYSDWLSGAGPGINLEDMQGMMEVCRGLHGPALDILIHSPGGSAEATASIVGYLRRQFDEIRVFVPLAAMSAATMWSLAANEWTAPFLR
jgi:ClpP class serine protease